MAIDTAEKRFSMMGFASPIRKYIVPDGAVDADARSTFLNLYSGITLTASISPWTEQADETTSWSVQADSSTTWTVQTDSSTTWTVQ